MLLRFALSILFLSLVIQCSLFEPEPANGSLVIVLEREALYNNLEKVTQIKSIHCIITKGDQVKISQELLLQGNSFHGEYHGLPPGHDYQIILCGRDASNAVMMRGEEAKITVQAGQETLVPIDWLSFVVQLISPHHRSTTNNPLAEFHWRNVVGAATYLLEVDNNTDFSSPEIRLELNDIWYQASTGLTDGTYYWQVRAKDALQNWGTWSEVWSIEFTSGNGCE